MGKKGTKRKTKWRALPLGEEAGGSGNEEELHDEDQSTTSSVIGHTVINNTYKAQVPYYKGIEKPFRQNRRFSYDRYKSKEPLVKLESKTFDEEEYTKITTPRQDVLFKKGYFGRKKESSIEETTHHSGEVEGEEPMMDQIIITNGFVDERGHYLVNGNSYEIYDPYSNTVTVVVGPPPYTNGVTQPVLAAVSCQPVPLQPVDWYPPGSDWPTQGSAWTPSYPRPYQTATAESLNSPRQTTENVANFHGAPDSQIPNLYQQPAYIVPRYVFNESSVYANGEIGHRNNRNHTTDALCSNENKLKITEDSFTEANGDAEKKEPDEEEEVNLKSQSQREALENSANPTVPTMANAEPTVPSVSSGTTAEMVKDKEWMRGEVAKEREEVVVALAAPSVDARPPESAAKPVIAKQSHSTQTNSIDGNDQQQQVRQLQVSVDPRRETSYKESHSTQTASEHVIPSSTSTSTGSNKPVSEAGEKAHNSNNNNHHHHHHHNINNNKQAESESSFGKPETEARTTSWKTQQYNNRHREYQYPSPRKYQDESPSPRKTIYQKRTNFNDEKNLKFDVSDEKSEAKAEPSRPKMSYAKKAMAGLDNANDKNSNKVVNSVLPNNGKIPNGLKNAQTPNLVVNGTSQTAGLGTNGITRTNHPKPTTTESVNSHEEKKDYSSTTAVKNGFVKHRYAGKTCSYGNNRGGAGGVSGNHDRNGQKDLRPERKDKKIQLKSFVEVVVADGKDKEEGGSESASQSGKSSTLSELSSPTELSSGQNTPPEKLILRKMEQKIANEINKSFEEKLKQNLTKKNEAATAAAAATKKVDKTEVALPQDDNIQETECKVRSKQEGKKRNNNNSNSSHNKGNKQTEEREQTSKLSKKKKKKQAVEEAKEANKTECEASNGGTAATFLPNFIMQEPQDLIFRSWKGVKNEEVDLISKMDTTLTGDEDILKTLGIHEDKMNFSKLPLHSDLLMMLPAFGWNRPKFKIEDMFTPSKQLHNDLFTRRNITSMKSTKPEEFFASVVDSPTVNEKTDKRKSGNKQAGANKQSKTLEETPDKSQSSKESKLGGSGTTAASKKTTTGNTGKSTNSSSKTSGSKVVTKNKVNKEGPRETIKPEVVAVMDVKEKKLGIVDAVNTWLQEQESAEKVLSMDLFQAQSFEQSHTSRGDGEDVAEENENKGRWQRSGGGGGNSKQKNVMGNPMHALSPRQAPGRKDDDSSDSVSLGHWRGVNECIRVANVINDNFVRINGDLFPGCKQGFANRNRKPRSSSLDGKLSDRRIIKKHLKFLTDSASFCQDLISDVRNGLPAKSDGEYATEELCDPKQSVLKYYTLSPGGRDTVGERTVKTGKSRQESDSENEAFDALEYKFLQRDSVPKETGVEEEVGRGVDRTGNVSVTDSGVHSDMDSSEDTANDQQQQQQQQQQSKDVTCKLQ